MVLEGFSWKTQGETESTREYARLRRTSVRVQGTDKLLYIRGTRHQRRSENIGER